MGRASDGSDGTGRRGGARNAGTAAGWGRQSGRGCGRRGGSPVGKSGHGVARRGGQASPPPPPGPAHPPWQSATPHAFTTTTGHPASAVPSSRLPPHAPGPTAGPPASLWASGRGGSGYNGWGGPQGGWDGTSPPPGPSFATPACGPDGATPSAPPSAASVATPLFHGASDLRPPPHHQRQTDAWTGVPSGGAPPHSPFYASTPSSGVPASADTPSSPSVYTDTTGVSPPMSMTGMSGPGSMLLYGPGSAGSGGSGPGAAGASNFNTPALDGPPAPLPGPPRKHAAAQEQMASFPGFRAPDGAFHGGGGAATPSTIGSGYGGGGTYGGAPGAGGYGAGGGASVGPDGSMPPRAIRLAVDDGKVRKVSGRSLFPEAGAGGGAGGGAGAGGGYSPSRRSSRLAALAGSGGGSAPASPAAGSRAFRGPGGGVGGWLHQSQNQPDPLDPPFPPGQQQNVTDAKLGPPRIARSRAAGNAQTVLFSLASGADVGGPVGGDAAVASRHSALGQVVALAMLCHAYEAYRHMAMFRGTEALEEFQRLPVHQHHTAWVYIQVGQVLLERMEYHQAAAAFEAAHQLDRHRVEGLESYSTVLWHLRRETDLSFLAQTAIATDRLAPQSWCVLGNLFSLHKEHEAALKLFERALQLDPTFTYAYTLSGHEYSASEELDKALACYRNALRTDPRHYNALYGMGCVYFRQEKYDVALCHFRSAATISPRSSVLHCYVGMTLARQACYEQALTKLQEAIELDPKNPLARYEKAGVLAAQGAGEAALKEYRTLVHLAPGEASVYLQMGRLYKRLGLLPAAQRQLELALSFTASSGDAAAVKAAIDKLGVNEEQDEEEL